VPCERNATLPYDPYNRLRTRLADASSLPLVRVTLIHNPASGDDAQPSAEDLIALLRFAGHDVTYRSCHDENWIDSLEDPGELLAIAGGDGTIADVAKRVIGRGIPLALLPLGTANNIGRTLGLADASLEQHVMGWHIARRTLFDVGVAKGPWGARYFLESMGVGLFAEVMPEAEASPTLVTLDRADARMAYALQMLKENVRQCRCLTVNAMLDGRDVSGRYILFEAMNTQYIGPNLYLAPHGYPADGAFDLVLATESERDRLEHCFSSWQNGVLRLPELPSHRGRDLRIQWDGHPLHLDDRLERSAVPGAVPFDVKVSIARGALELLLPV
jgi:diacylglycerol kinase family enzyme